MPIIPVGTLISLASLDSFPLKGGSLFCVGRGLPDAPTVMRAPSRRAPRKMHACRAMACPRRAKPSPSGEGGTAEGRDG